MRRSKFNFFLFYKSKNIKFWESNPKNIWKNKMNEKKQHGVETIKSWQEKLHKKEKQNKNNNREEQAGRWYSESANRLPDTSNSFRM